MNTILRSGFILLSLYVSLAAASDKTSDPDVLAFVPPMPVIPTAITPNTTVGPFTYTIKNNVNSTVGLDIEVLDANGLRSVQVKRAGGTCGDTLAPHATCTLVYNIITSSTLGINDETLIVEPIGREEYQIESKISFETTTTAGTYAFVVNETNDTVSACQINLVAGSQEGDLSCSDSGANNLTDPIGIALQTVNGTPYAYITNRTTFTVTQCTVAGASLTNCNPGSPLYSNGFALRGITFYTSNNNLYAYIAANETFNFLVRKCDVNSTSGLISNCQDAGATGLSSVEFITFQTFNGVTYAYIGDFVLTDSVKKCTLDNSTGNFVLNSCVPAGADLDDLSYQAAFAQVGSNNYAYVTLFNNGIFKCDVNTSTGLFPTSSCAATGGISASSPRGIVEKTINGNQYLYAANFQQSVSKCKVDTTSAGALICSDSGGTGFSNPFGIAIQ